MIDFFFKAQLKHLKSFVDIIVTSSIKGNYSNIICQVILNQMLFNVYFKWTISLYNCTLEEDGTMAVLQESHLRANLQSGAGHQRVSGSAARKRRSWNSSKRSSRAPSSRMARTSGRASTSGHCGQAMPTRLSEISMRRYWRKQSVQARCWQEDRRGKWPRGWLRRQSGHSTRCSSSWSWLEEDKDSTPIEPLLPHSTPPSSSSSFPGSPPSLPPSNPTSLWARSWEETGKTKWLRAVMKDELAWRKFYYIK